MNCESFFEMSNVQSKLVPSEVVMVVVEEVCDNDVRRLAQKASVKKMSSAVPKAMRLKINEEIDNLLRVAVPVVLASKRKTVSEEDVQLASKHLGLRVFA